MENLNYGINPAILVWILLLNFIIYVGTVWIKFGIQPSVSDSFYSWKPPWGHLFTIFCWILAFPLVMLAEVMPENYEFIPFISGGGFAFVGAACMIKKPDVMAIHGKAAAIGITAGLLMIGFGFGGWYWAGVGSGLLIAGILALLNISNKIWWIEIAAFLTIIASLIFKFLI